MWKSFMTVNKVIELNKNLQSCSLMRPCYFKNLVDNFCVIITEYTVLQNEQTMSNGFLIGLVIKNMPNCLHLR